MHCNGVLSLSCSLYHKDRNMDSSRYEMCKNIVEQNCLHVGSTCAGGYLGSTRLVLVAASIALVKVLVVVQSAGV